MRYTLLANAVAFALFSAFAACAGVCSWEVLLFQLVLQVLTNEFWMDVFMLPFKGQHLFGVVQGRLADPVRIRRVARWTCAFVFVFPAVVLAVLACVNYWGAGALGQALHLPLEMPLFGPSLLAQGVLCAISLAGGLVPLSYRTVIEALMARRERRLVDEGDVAASVSDAAVPPPARAGVEMLPHGVPEGVVLPACLACPQCCSPLHAQHAEMVRGKLREGERAILSTAPAGVVDLPSSSNERFYGGVGLCLAALLLYAAIGLFEEASSRVVTRWVVLLLGVGLLPLSVRVLRAAARRQALLRRTDYFLTNYRLHSCCAGVWSAVSLGSAEVLAGGEYGGGRGDVMLCPESAPEPTTLINVECAQELCVLLERLVHRENAR